MNQKNIAFSPNKEENIIDLSSSTVCNICLSGLKFANGQLSYTIDLSKDGIFPFSNGMDNGYAEYNSTNKKIEIFGDVRMYIIYN